MYVSRDVDNHSFSRAGRALLLGTMGAVVGAVSGAIATMFFNDAPLLRNMAVGSVSGCFCFLWRGMSKDDTLFNNYVCPAIMAGILPSATQSSLTSSAFFVGFNTFIANWVVPKLEKLFPHEPDDTNNLYKKGKPFLEFR